MHRQRLALKLNELYQSSSSINVVQDGCTPLHLACINRQSEVVNILLSAGAMPDIVENVDTIM